MSEFQIHVYFMRQSAMMVLCLLRPNGEGHLVETLYVICDDGGIVRSDIAHFPSQQSASNFHLQLATIILSFFGSFISDSRS